MVYFPQYLHGSFNRLCKSCLARRLYDKEDAYEYFESVLNMSLPKPDSDEFRRHMDMKDMVRSLVYIMSRKGPATNYIKLVKNTPWECTILWTSPAVITAYFNLMHKAYIKWDNKTNKYSVTKFVSKKTAHVPPSVHPIVQDQQERNKEGKEGENDGHDSVQDQKGKEGKEEDGRDDDEFSEANDLKPRSDSWADIADDDEKK